MATKKPRGKEQPPAPASKGNRTPSERELAGILIERHGSYRVIRRADVPFERIRDALSEPGQQLKASKTSKVRRVGSWVIKESAANPVAGAVRHTLLRNRYRRGWRAAVHLQKAGVFVPTPIAYIERYRAGVVWRNAIVMEFLDGCCNVEQFVKGRLDKGANPSDFEDFFARLAAAVNGLSRAEAYHSDLSGKNIFTKDGNEFYFIDLDGCVLGGTYTEDLRFRNHVQLYDSFCDWFPDEVLTRFLSKMLDREHKTGDWMDRVRAAQAKRRARTVAVWRKQGKC